MTDFSADWLRQRFLSRESGGGFRTATAPAGPSLVPAAVLVPIVQRPESLTVLLTERTAHLRDHAGQVSFPGGRSEPADPSPVATALREAQEEVGLDPARVEVLGMLDEYLTGTGFAIRPVVGLVTPPLDLKLDEFEVTDVFEPPLEFLLRAANFSRRPFEHGGVVREYWAVPWQGRHIWGATAAMLVSLREFLLGGM